MRILKKEYKMDSCLRRNDRKKEDTARRSPTTEKERKVIQDTVI